LFASIFLYFHQYQPTCPDWYAIVIYPSRRQLSALPLGYNGIAPRHLREIYLDELESPPQSLGIGIVKLVIESGNPAKEFAQQLVFQAKQELTDTIIQEKVLQFIETIVLYKFPNLTPKEIEAMLSVSLLKGTRVYQEIKAEVKEEIEGEIRGKIEGEIRGKIEGEIKGKIEGEIKGKIEGEIKGKIEGEIREENTLETKLGIVQKLLQKDMSIQEVAALVELDEETVRKAIE